MGQTMSTSSKIIKIICLCIPQIYPFLSSSKETLLLSWFNHYMVDGPRYLTNLAYIADMFFTLKIS